MFTGIVETLGEVVSVEQLDGDAARLTVAAGSAGEGVRPGESVAVDGVCLTVTGFAGTGPGAPLRFDVMGETLRRSTLGERRPGDPVNLERALRVGDRLGGHVVQGHVDGTATISGAPARKQLGDRSGFVAGGAGRLCGGEGLDRGGRREPYRRRSRRRRVLRRARFRRRCRRPRWAANRRGAA